MEENLVTSWNSLIVLHRLPGTEKTGGTRGVELQMLLFSSCSCSHSSSSPPPPPPPAIWNYFLENNIGTSTQNIISVNCHKLNTLKQHTQIRKQHCTPDWPKSSTVMTAFYKLTSNMVPSMLGKCVAFQLT